MPIVAYLSLRYKGRVYASQYQFDCSISDEPALLTRRSPMGSIKGLLSIPPLDKGRTGVGWVDLRSNSHRSIATNTIKQSKNQPKRSIGSHHEIPIGVDTRPLVNTFIRSILIRSKPGFNRFENLSTDGDLQTCQKNLMGRSENI
jgi:hypothetical protein